MQKYERLLAEDEAGRLKAERQGLNDKRRKNVKSQLPDLEKCYAGCEAAFASVDGLIQASMERVMVRENVDVIKEKTKEGQADLENAHRLLKARTLISLSGPNRHLDSGGCILSSREAADG